MRHPQEKGVFTISLDFELYWGVRDYKTIDNYRGHLLGVRKVVPTLLGMFNDYEIHATWATVGFLFFENHDDLIRGLPNKKPYYKNERLSPYSDIYNIGRNEEGDPFHYAPSLIKLIKSYPNQEIGSHTFSHYYCLEAGQSIDTFKDDIEAVIKVGKKYDIIIKSIIFPRNQVNREYLSICKRMGIKSYRGNEALFFYKGSSLFRRTLRLLDAYLKISGHNCYLISERDFELPLNIPSSRFLRPYSKKYRVFEPLRLRRILSGLTYAARKGLIYHLWWHPHNFGVNNVENISFLKKILDHYMQLKTRYEMQSLNMGEIADKYQKERNLI